MLNEGKTGERAGFDITPGIELANFEEEIMMSVAVAERQKLYTQIDRLPDNKLPPVIEYVTSM